MYRCILHEDRTTLKDRCLLNTFKHAIFLLPPQSPKISITSLSGTMKNHLLSITITKNKEPSCIYSKPYWFIPSYHSTQIQTQYDYKMLQRYTKIKLYSNDCTTGFKLLLPSASWTCYPYWSVSNQPTHPPQTEERWKEITSLPMCFTFSQSKSIYINHEKNKGYKICIKTIWQKGGLGS